MAQYSGIVPAAFTIVVIVMRCIIMRATACGCRVCALRRISMISVHSTQLAYRGVRANIPGHGLLASFRGFVCNGERGLYQHFPTERVSRFQMVEIRLSLQGTEERMFLCSYFERANVLSICKFIVRNLSSGNDLDGRVISKLPFERESFLEKRNKGDHLIPHQLYRTDRPPVRACQISTASRSAIFGRTSMAFIHFALTSASFRSVDPQSQIVP
ncbi:hypothetical protein SISNIDRAFT_543033 [Sistotremastrum niveocremeum HHB9708]|uniref:Uncharacterized protein n=2 Tax=Sistotremastraceae TaxID=3402574 RepID=A0A164WJE9_9AGAM|nr:hypothetical protein SISNIDRAFT_543033 [Sistotremastrum niveocremeum HHB9708]KZT34627.1 hypothetical protein SISSUDRAFT_1082684 [Sistotremastrum suecicum HHB10207 ss-3]